MMGLMLVLPLLASAAGIGVGNGGDGDRAAYIAKMQKELSMQNNADAEAVAEWCSRATRVLRREKQRAMLQVQYDQLATAEQILMDALVTASQSLNINHRLGTPMTKRLIDRGVIYADGIKNALNQNGSSRLSLLTEIDFMTGFIDLIVRADEELNIPYYIPYHYRYGRCRDRCDGFDFRAFERLYLQYAHAELKFVVDHSVNRDYHNGRVVVTPIGRPAAFLKLAELSSGLLAKEISETLEAYRNACVVSDLMSLHDILRDYNLFGDRSYFPNERYAIEGTAQEISRILNNFTNGSCSLPRHF